MRPSSKIPIICCICGTKCEDVHDGAFAKGVCGRKSCFEKKEWRDVFRILRTEWSQEKEDAHMEKWREERLKQGYTLKELE